MNTIPATYQKDVALMHAKMRQASHQRAHIILAHQGVRFFSPEFAFFWKEYRDEVLSFWEPMSDASMVTQVRLQMDDLVRQDEELEAAYQRAQWQADHADEVRDEQADVEYMDWVGQEAAV